MYLTAAFAANLPSVKDPDENLCALPPTVSPAPNNPSIAVSYTHLTLPTKA